MGPHVLLPNLASLIFHTAIQGLWLQGLSLYHRGEAGDFTSSCQGSQEEAIDLNSSESSILLVAN